MLTNPPFLFGCNTLLTKSVWKKVNGYDEKLKTNGEDIDFIHKIRSQTNSQIIYQPEANVTIYRMIILSLYQKGYGDIIPLDIK